MRIGQYYTADRIVCTDAGYTMAPVLLNGGVALLHVEKAAMKTGVCGAPSIFRFVFQFLDPGKAEIQLANFRTFEYRDVEKEDVISFEVEDVDCISRETWSSYEPLSLEDRAFFDRFVSPLVDEKFTPYRVSTLEEEGLFYRYVCAGERGVSPKRNAIITISVPEPGKGEPSLISIERYL